MRLKMEFKSKMIGRIGVMLIVAMAFLTIAAPDQTFAAKKKVKKITFENAKSARKVISKGKKVKLKVTVSPKGASKRMTFTSSNKKVATISKSGVITTKKKGTTYITAKAKDGSKKKKKVKVIVGTPVKKVTVTGANEVIKDKSINLSAKIYPSNATYKGLLWKSSNTSIATVNSRGKVTYKRDGIVTITVWARDGSKKKGTFKVKATSLKKNEANYIAHRGFSSIAPENSLAAYELACKNGFGGVECDLWEVMTENENHEESGGSIEISGVDNSNVETDFVLIHDSSLDRTTSESGSIKNKTFDELIKIRLTYGNGLSAYLNQTIPSLEEYLMIMAKYPNSIPVIEIKSYGSSIISEKGAKKLVQLLEKYNLQNKASIISFGKDALTRISEIDPNIHTTLLFNPTPELLSSNIKWAKENGVNALSMNYTLTDSMMIKAINNTGLQSGVYTVNSYKMAYEFIRLYNVDYLTSDYKHF